MKGWEPSVRVVAKVAARRWNDHLRVVAGGRLMPAGARERGADSAEPCAWPGSSGVTVVGPMSPSLVGALAQIKRGASSKSRGLGPGAAGVEGQVPSNNAVKQTALAGGILVKAKRVAVGAAAYGWRWKVRPGQTRREEKEGVVVVGGRRESWSWRWGWISAAVVSGESGSLRHLEADGSCDHQGTPFVEGIRQLGGAPRRERGGGVVEQRILPSVRRATRPQRHGRRSGKAPLRRALG